MQRFAVFAHSHFLKLKILCDIVADIIEPQMRLTARRLTELAGFRQPAYLRESFLLKRKTRLGA